MNATEVDQIVEQVLAGDVEAYAEVVRRYQREVWKVVTAMLHDVKVTEDLVQQAFVNAYLHLSQYQPGSDFAVWVKSIARNLVRQELRSRSRETRRLDIYRKHLLDRFKDDDTASKREEALGDALRRCREKLPEHSTEVLDLRYARAMSFEEIAAGLGRTVEATRQLLSRVRLLLRDCIEKKMAGA
jgi:RNA polymerase sigma-70 factor (ECF subfamily)